MSYGGYGTCPAMDVLVASVRTAMKQVSVLGHSGADLVGIDPRFERGVEFLDRHDAWRGWGMGVLYGEGCVAAVAEGQSVLDGVNGLLAEYGVEGTTSDIRPEATPGGPLDALRPIVIAAAVVAGAVLLFPVVQEILVTRRTQRRLGRRRS